MKKCTISMILAVSVLGLSACGGVALNEKQTAEVAEYSAGLIVKYDKGYKKYLIYPELTPTPLPTLVPKVTSVPTATPSAVTGDNNKPGSSNKPSGGAVTEPSEQTAYSLEQVLGIDGIKVTCKKVELVDEYSEPGNDYYRVYASSGKKLAVVSFQLKNTANIEKRLYFTELGVDYKLKLADGTTSNSQLTVISNDLNFFNGRIKAGKKKAAVLVFEVSNSADLKGAQIQASSGERQALVQLSK